MTTIKLRTHVDDDGVLRLNIPSSLQGADVDVTITIEKVTAESEPRLSWSKGFFDEVLGGWQGETLERPPQGAYPAREALE